MPSDNKINQAKKNKISNNFKERIKKTIVDDFQYTSPRKRFKALSYGIRDFLADQWIKTKSYYYEVDPRRVYYLSFEFLLGRTLENTIINLQVEKECFQAMADLGINLNELKNMEWDAGLGNGGLGRLAACFLDSMASLHLPAQAYGIRYEFGMFEQKIIDNKQIEFPDTWLQGGNPFEIEKIEIIYTVNFGGRVQNSVDFNGQIKSEWVDFDRVLATAYDLPIPGYNTETVNTLRLWSARATREFNLKTFDDGDYAGAVHDKNATETISKVLYPNDNAPMGKELRLKQQYFMVSASIQDIIKRYMINGKTIDTMPEKVVIHLNDTHPTLGIPELMRILLDVYHLSWQSSWEITNKIFAFTNHTVLPEALEVWPVSLFEKFLPRHLQIIYEINARFMAEVLQKFPGDVSRQRRMSIVSEDGVKSIRMAYMAVVGSFSVNGVAELHSKLLTTTIFKDFYEMFPHKFTNVTNGVTHRRWLRLVNPGLSTLITDQIGPKWITNLKHLKGLEKFATDTNFQDLWMAQKARNKERLAQMILEKCLIKVDTQSLFDVQVKRIHEYKRQLLNLFHCLYFYHQVKDNPNQSFVPRTVVFAGKAAPGYFIAKLIINLINCVANVVNKDPAVHDVIKIVFIPNYGVTIAETIIPGADLSEQTSTAGLEASGTGNMKFALNGALTIGTLDGANIEIKDEVGDENIFIFGNTVEDLALIKKNGYDPNSFYHSVPALKRIIDEISSGYYSPDDRKMFKPIVDNLLVYGDPYFLMADFQKYVDCQKTVSDTFLDNRLWHQKAILNVARMGKFSSDRAIQEYCDKIWKVKPCPLVRSKKADK